MNLEKRLKSIVKLLTDDMVDGGAKFNTSKKYFKRQLIGELMRIEEIEKFHTYEIIFMILEKYNAMQLIDKSFVLTKLSSSVLGDGNE